MNTTLPADPVSVRTVLFDDGDLASALRSDGVGAALADELAGLGAQVRTEAVDAVGRLGAELLDLDLADLALGAWSRRAELRAAARETLAEPGSERSLALFPHVISLEQQPAIDVLLDGVAVARVEFSLALSVRVDGLVATVRHGRLTRLRTGALRVEAALAVAGRRCAHGERVITLPLERRLGDGIPLVDGARRSR